MLLICVLILSVDEWRNMLKCYGFFFFAFFCCFFYCWLEISSLEVIIPVSESESSVFSSVLLLAYTARGRPQHLKVKLWTSSLQLWRNSFSPLAATEASVLSECPVLCQHVRVQRKKAAFAESCTCFSCTNSCYLSLGLEKIASWCCSLSFVSLQPLVHLWF